MPPATIRPLPWLEFLRSEYLESFIKDGGTSIKFVVPMEEGIRESLEEGIVDRARDSGFLVTRVSSADTRIHLMDQVFFRVAEQIPWRRLSEEVIIKLAKAAGYVTPFGQEPEPLVRRLAIANRIDPDMLTMLARHWISTQVFQQQSLAKDFRVAVTQLCLAELSGGSDGETIVKAITDWLTGRNRAVSAVKPYQIFTRVTRSNARHLLETLLLWVRFAGYAGMAILLDISRVTIPRNPHDERVYYSKAAMFDVYELLRQFIDATDRMRGLLFIVMGNADFLDLEPSGRGMGAYDALKLRVFDEVRDQRLVNPMTALVRVSSGGVAA